MSNPSDNPVSYTHLAVLNAILPQTCQESLPAVADIVVLAVFRRDVRKAPGAAAHQIGGHILGPDVVVAGHAAAKGRSGINVDQNQWNGDILKCGLRHGRNSCGGDDDAVHPVLYQTAQHLLYIPVGLSVEQHHPHALGLELICDAAHQVIVKLVEIF